MDTNNTWELKCLIEIPSIRDIDDRLRKLHEVSNGSVKRVNLLCDTLVSL